MKLSSVKSGEVRVRSVDAPLYFRRRMYAYGLVPNTKILVRGRGVYIVAGVMLGIDREIADKIVVAR